MAVNHYTTTHWRKILTCLSFSLTLACPNLSLALACRGIFNSFESQFWESTTPIYLDKGKTANITLSHDTEIRPFMMIFALAKDPRTREKMKVFLPRIETTELSDLSGLSHQQLMMFGIRKDAEKNKSSYTAAELQLDVLRKIWKTGGSTTAEAIIGSRKSRNWQELKQMFLDMLAEAGAPVQANNDGGMSLYLEINTIGSKALPKDLKNEAMAIWNTASSKNVLPDMHLHLGLPSSEVSKSQAMTIGAALEVRIVLELAADSSTVNPLRYKSSPLRWETERGVVYVKPNEFSIPQKAHDVEIRQYFGIEKGLELVAFSANLAVNRARLIKAKRKYGTESYDPTLGNIKGVLERAGELVGKLSGHEMKEISEGLIRLAEKIPNKQEAMSLELREEMTTFLKQHEVERIFANPEVFLEQQ